MLKEGYLSEIDNGKFTNCRYLLVMRNRGNPELAPSESLLNDFMACKKNLENNMVKVVQLRIIQPLMLRITNRDLDKRFYHHPNQCQN